MSKAIRIALGLMAVLPFAARADVPFDQIIVFGASFDDSGQYPDIEVNPALGLRFTNVDPLTGERGLSMPEWLALDLGLGRMNPSTPLLVFGPRTDTLATDNINFAVGGYRSEEVLASVIGNSVVSVGPFSATQPGFLDRVAAGSVSFGPNTLFYAFIAGNDMRDVDDPLQTAAVSAQAIKALVDAGAGYIVVPNLPRLGQLSESTNLTATGRSQLSLDRTAAALAFNDALDQQLSNIDGNFIRIDLRTLYDEVLADPASFGYSASIDQTRECYSNSELGGINCNEPAGLGKASGGDPNDFVFNDGLHPTQATARSMADLIESVIRAPGMVALLPETILGDAQAYQNTLGDYLAQNRFTPQSRTVRWFTSVQGAATDTDETRATVEARSDALDLTIGASYLFDEAWFAGAAVGSQQSDTDFAASGGGFETSGLFGSVFVGYRRDGWFADVVLSMGKADIDDVERTFNIGSVQQRTESGDTEADVFGVSADVGVNMMAANTALRFGPFLGVDYVDINVNGYAEEGLRSSTMMFADLNRKSTLGSAGVFASYPLSVCNASVELRGDVAYEEEFEKHGDPVEAVVKTLAGGPWFRMPGYEIDNYGWRTTLGVTSAWKNGLRAGLSWRYRDNDAQPQYLTLSASYDL